MEDAHGVADKPKKKFIAAVRNEVESLKKNKKPIVDPSTWSSPMSDGYWKFYTKESSSLDTGYCAQSRIAGEWEEGHP